MEEWPYILGMLWVSEIKDDQVETLWVRSKRKANKADILLGVCHRSPNQKEEVGLLFF